MCCACGMLCSFTWQCEHVVGGWCGVSCVVRMHACACVCTCVRVYVCMRAHVGDAPSFSVSLSLTLSVCLWQRQWLCLCLCVCLCQCPCSCVNSSGLSHTGRKLARWTSMRERPVSVDSSLTNFETWNSTVREWSGDTIPKWHDPFKWLVAWWWRCLVAREFGRHLSHQCSKRSPVTTSFREDRKTCQQNFHTDSVGGYSWFLAYWRSTLWSYAIGNVFVHGFVQSLDNPGWSTLPFHAKDVFSGNGQCSRRVTQPWTVTTWKPRFFMNFVSTFWHPWSELKSQRWSILDAEHCVFTSDLTR